MKEYWVNVYSFPPDLINSSPISYGLKHNNKEDCIKECVDWGVWIQVPIYRIHVKMKPVKTGFPPGVIMDIVEANYNTKGLMDGYRSGY